MRFEFSELVNFVISRPLHDVYILNGRGVSKPMWDIWTRYYISHSLHYIILETSSGKLKILLLLYGGGPESYAMRLFKLFQCPSFFFFLFFYSMTMACNMCQHLCTISSFLFFNKNEHVFLSMDQVVWRNFLQ